MIFKNSKRIVVLSLYPSKMFNVGELVPVDKL